MATLLEWLLVLTLPVTGILVAWLVQLYDKRAQHRTLMSKIRLLSLNSVESLIAKEEAFPRWNRRPLVMNDDACNGCGHCMEDCPTDAIEIIPLQGSNPPRYLPIFLDDRCIKCGICVYSCPFDVIGTEYMG